MVSPAFAKKKSADLPISIGLAVVVFFFIASTLISYGNTRTTREQTLQVTASHQIILSMNELLDAVKDAETGQRGYVITGDEKYLQPYTDALPTIDEIYARLQSQLKPFPDEIINLGLIKQHIDAKLAELAQTIELRRTKGFSAAHAVILTDHGKNEMDSVRAVMSAMVQQQDDLRAQHFAEMDKFFRVTVITSILSGLLGVLLTFVIGMLFRRISTSQQRHDWLQTGQVNVSTAVTGDVHMELLGENLLSVLADYIGAQAAAFFVREEGYFKRVATYGVPENSAVLNSFSPGDGLLGQAVKDKKHFILSDVPDNYLYYGSGLGRAKPNHLLIFPVILEGRVNAVLELGFIGQPDPVIIELLAKASGAVGTAVRSVAYRSSLQNLLDETQRQSEELQVQSEELKVSNEELEEQSRALKESQTRLEQQQVEMEQTNSQLEEQTQILEFQRDELEQSRQKVQEKMTELEQASQYKSDFLANMSHELRTPLNSSLILAKLLADNKNGNLTEEQVLHARTIQAAGNDLLALINDILDLSKIEAGHMTVNPETIQLKRIVNDMTRLFEHSAREKGLIFHASIEENCPDIITSDMQRLQQVLKNLIANALKFTEKGKVTFTVKSHGENMLAFSVTDTGIGVSHDQQEAIFDAFRQADGTINRKYGGTGLGLSISRELARLLSGRIELVSELGKGSTFSVILPQKYEEGKSISSKAHESAHILSPRQHVAAHVRVKSSRQDVADDRDKLTGQSRVILIIEDDESFARILVDLAHELKFECLAATTTEDALILARQYMPSAVLLDIGLPDSSGLTVLDRIKHDPRLRHIPVHVISANDYSQTAYAMGAAGYSLKPVKREQLTDALKAIEERFSQNMRRVLIVEDDKVQRESVGKLLKAGDIETVGVGTAAECLHNLKEGTFDCMVLDLSLPDATGYSLLETLSTQRDYSFPPVIVYTGRDLSTEEEQRLRRYSRSIIIKGAKSPERLLDEVTLFLHQMVSELPPEQQHMLEKSKSRDEALEGKSVLVVEDDVRNIYAITSILEPQGIKVNIARNGREALDNLQKSKANPSLAVDLILMDVMMPEMDGLTATREIRKQQEYKKLPIIMLTAKAMRDDQERCLEAGANDYMAKPIDVEKLLSLVRVWMPR